MPEYLGQGDSRFRHPKVQTPYAGPIVLVANEIGRNFVCLKKEKKSDSAGKRGQRYGARAKAL
jgi:hypothetical protein